jgi:lipoprotein-anchoring transpeptidase ErfK/SrfK
VTALQNQLNALGYWLGPIDGVFGDSTEQAVFALQKAAGLPHDGVVGPVTAAAVAAGVVPHPRSTSGSVIEIDLTDDLMMFVTNGTLGAVLNTSTGGGYTYTSGGVTAVAHTPVGVFHIARQVDGMVTDSLGQLWRPKFFEGGFAIHGDGYVPAVPVSHGCARVSNEAIDWIWASNMAPIGTEVWVY